MTRMMTMMTKRGGELHGRQSCITCYETETNNFDRLALSGVRYNHYHLLQHHHCHSGRESEIVLVTLTKNSCVRS